MDELTDKRFRSFLWSQTNKSFYGETRLSLPGEVAATPGPVPAPPPPARSVPVPPAVIDPLQGVKKVKLTRLDQAAMRLSEHCIGPAPKTATPAVPAPESPEAAGFADTGWMLHVRLRVGEALPPDQTPSRHYVGLNVTKTAKD